MRRPAKSTWTAQIINFNTSEVICTDTFLGTSVFASVLQPIDQQADAALPDVNWGQYFTIPSNRVKCRRSTCRNYQQTASREDI